MFYAILSTFLNSLATSFWKKALSFNAPREFFNFIAYFSIILISLALFFFDKLVLSDINLKIFSLIVFLYLLQFVIVQLNQYVYSKEKISSILPYQNIHKVLVIILSFLIFWDISLITLIIALFTVLIIILFTVDFKTLKVPKSIKIFTFSQILETINFLMLWYLFTLISNVTFFIYSFILWIIFVWSIITYKKQLSCFKTLPKAFFKYRLIAAHIWWTSYILSLVVIQELWLSLSILLSYIWLGMTLFFSYLMFKDKPSKKDLSLIIIVSILIGVGYYFK